MICALIDTDIILDFLIQRKPFLDQASAIWEFNRVKQFEGYVAAITPINVFYFARKASGQAKAHEVIGDLLREWQVCPVNKDVLSAVYTSGMRDFEDAVQNASAHALHLDYIVTRNFGDYEQATIPVLTPDDFLTRLNAL